MTDNWKPITVKDLIDNLSQYPPDMPVIGSGDDCVDFRQFIFGNAISDMVDVSLIKIEQWNDGEVDLEIISTDDEASCERYYKKHSPYGCNILKRFTAVRLKV